MLPHLLHAIHQLKQNLFCCDPKDHVQAEALPAREQLWQVSWDVRLARAWTVVRLRQGVGLQHAGEGSEMVSLVVTTSGQQAGASQMMIQVQSQAEAYLQHSAG